LKVETAKLSGYCFGVKRALELTSTILDKYKNKNINVYSIGEIIHNKGVIENLRSKGLKVVESVEEIKPGSIFIVRSHGLSPQLIEKIKSRKVKIIDTACPFVKRAQSKAKMLSKRGYHLVIIGNKKHPEVMSEMEYADKDNLSVIETPQELLLIGRKDRIGVIMQTTQIKENAKAIIGGLLDRANEILVENTICNTTEKRQKITSELASRVDIMIIVGGKNSANTTHLAQIAKKHNPCTYHIEKCSEIDISWFKPGMSAGISGGASTPQEDIKSVRDYLESLDI